MGKDCESNPTPADVTPLPQSVQAALWRGKDNSPPSSLSIFPSFPIHQPAKVLSRVGSIMGHILYSIKAGDGLMPRRKTQPANEVGRFKAIMDSATALKVGMLISGVLFGLWTNSIQLEQTKLKAELAEVKATAVKERETSQAQITLIKNKQDACEQKYDKALKAIQDAAKRLPPSPTKRLILTLTRPQQSGKVTEPMRANEPLPKFYSDGFGTSLPAYDERYFDWRKTN